MSSDLWWTRSRRPQRPPLSPIRLALRCCLLGAAVVTAPLLGAAPASAQQAGYGQTLGTTPMERQIYDAGTGRPNSGTILDSTNPIDLMNRLRRSTAMDDATPPASAIDQALQQLEAQSAPAGSSQAAAGGVSGAAARPAALMPGSQPPAVMVVPQSQPASTSQTPAL